MVATRAVSTRVVIALLFGISTLVACVATAAPRADLYLFNGRILAGVDDAGGKQSARWIEALLVHDGRIAAAGKRADVEAEIARLQLKPRRVDLAGRFAMPGLCDAHGHFASLGFSLDRLQLRGATSPEQVAQIVAEAAKTRAKGEWIQGRGWDQNLWAVKKFPTAELLDRAAPDNPVWLRRVDGHAAWANSRALALAGVTRGTPDPDGGRIERDADGRPTGVLVDNATRLVERAVPTPSREQLRAALLRAGENCAQFGLTAVHEPGIDSVTVEAFRELANSGELPTRVFAMLSAATAMRPGMLPAKKITAGEGLFRVFAVKAYADGALGSRGAALLADYSDDPGNRGLLVTPPDSLEIYARACLAHGYPLCTHAIGDRGNRVALDAYERAAGGAAGLQGKRFRIEHAQVLSPQDLPRFARDGIIASMQPTHCTSDMPWAPDRLGAERVKGAYAWRQLLNSGARLALGSDFPVESPDPRLGIYAAITTQKPDGTPPAGFRPGEKLTILEALRGFTSDAAYAAWAEHEVGRLEKGMRADVTVFDRDLTSVAPAEILKARCEMTVVDGRVEYEAAGR
ncbi:MAG TPA: amidohydrolase [Candidatus Sulfotelmatobacter sp.]|nr:amidohydrolase [Candidatus Sulfotelmatobacter sp.]